ncbi:MAG: hypothetical protein WEB00_10090 [Dehalococcoidia bacterium]
MSHTRGLIPLLAVAAALASVVTIVLLEVTGATDLRGGGDEGDGTPIASQGDNSHGEDDLGESSPGSDDPSPSPRTRGYVPLTPRTARSTSGPAQV